MAIYQGFQNVRISYVLHPTKPHSSELYWNNTPSSGGFIGH